jgi:glycosyltransferase involved in cell wall biosynthesis
MRQLVDVVPFGTRSAEPRHTAKVLKGVYPRIDEEDKVLLWGGGLWEWLDPLTAIRGMALVGHERDDVRLVFPGTRHPNPGVQDMPVRRESVRLADELGLLDRCVFFGDWVPYEDWPNYLLEADIGLSLHRDTVEARLAFRTRVMDYLWAGLPMVVTEGDATSDLVSRLKLGEVVGHGAEEEFAGAVLRLLREGLPGSRPRFEEARANLTWERAARPLLSFCERPTRAPDRRADDAVPGADRTQPDLSSDELGQVRERMQKQEAEIAELRDLVSRYEDGRFVRLMRWVHRRRHPRGTQ